MATTKYYLRRDGNQSPEAYDVKQLLAMVADGNVLETDEMRLEDGEDWTSAGDMEELFPKESPEPASAWPPPAAATATPSGTSGQKLLAVITGLPDKTLMLIFWISMGVLLIGIFLPWVSIQASSSSGYGSTSAGASAGALWFGIGWLTLLSGIAAVVFSLIRVLKIWCWIPTAFALIFTFITIVSPPGSNFSTSGSSSYGGFSSRASLDVGAGVGVYLSFLAVLVATAAGLAIFLKFRSAKE